MHKKPSSLSSSASMPTLQTSTEFGLNNLKKLNINVSSPGRRCSLNKANNTIYALQNSGMYPRVAETLQFNLASYDYLTLVKYKGDKLVPLNGSSRETLKHNPSGKPLWRKREVVRQERSVYYTTIGADGVQQELMEKETTQTEVLHMECKETGEFAHRETTQYEQVVILPSSLSFSYSFFRLYFLTFSILFSSISFPLLLSLPHTLLHFISHLSLLLSLSLRYIFTSSSITHIHLYSRKVGDIQ